MGKHSGRPGSAHYGGRAGAGKDKRIKEIERKRSNGASLERLSIEDQKIRLKNLASDISNTFDPYKSEILYTQFANLAASCADKVFVPTEMRGIVRYSDLSDQDMLDTISSNPNAGSISDFLPLHHIVKLLAKTPGSVEATDHFIYLLGSTSGRTDTQGTPEIPLRNIRALEYFLGLFSSRMRPGKTLNVEIDRNRVAVPYIKGGDYLIDQNPSTILLRNLLGRAGIDQSSSYKLNRMSDGGIEVGMPLIIATEERRLERRGGKIIQVSYAMPNPV